MNQDYSGTKRSLLLAAGELFAEHGLEGASIRAIAEKAGANIAAVNYHFGSKESLFLAVVNYLLDEDYERIRIEEHVERARGLTTPEEFAELLRDMVERRFAVYFDPEGPEWHSRLFLRTFLESAELLRDLVRERFSPDHEALRQIFRLANPNLDEEEVEQFAMGFMAHISFYCMAKTLILMHMQQEKYTERFLEHAADHVTKLLAAGLGLPNPVKSNELPPLKC